MGVQCKILVNKAKGGVHIIGHAVTGKVKYLIDEPTEYQHVTLSLLGKGKCVWRQGTARSGRTNRGSEDYVISHINICNKKLENTITLNGKYEHPFEFVLPENIPGTYKDRICCISYRIQIKFEKPGLFSFNKVFTADVPVYSYLTAIPERPISFRLQKELFAPFSSKTPVVDLKAEINKTFLTPGEKAQITYVVTNDSDVDVTSVNTKLYCHTTYTSNYGTKKRVKTLVDSCEAQTLCIPKREVSTCVCVLPIPPQLYSIQNSKVIRIEYKVRATIKLPMPHMNETVEMPVLIGEAKEDVEAAVAMMEGGDQPPSYWEVMNEGKGKSDDESD